MAMSPTSVSGDTDISSPNQNSTDEEKIYSTLGRPQRLGVDSTPQQKQAAFSLDDRQVNTLVLTNLVLLYIGNEFY